MLSIGILSWKAHQTLINTLQNYHHNELFRVSDDIHIFFNEISERDLKIASKYNWINVHGSTLNIGIGPALKKLVQYSKHELFMFLENDWLLVDRQPNLEKITIAAQMVTAGAQFVKLRNHVNPGLPMFSFAHIGNERASENLYALSDCIFWQGFEAGLNNPELQVIKLTNSNEHFLVTTSRFSNYTNNPAIYHRNFFNLAVKSHIRLGEQLEATIHDNWINSNHPSIAHMFHGPFTHNRLDR